MKLYLVILVVLFSVKSFATCTQFNGNWSCAGQSFPIDVQEKQGQDILVLNQAVSLLISGQQLREAVPGGAILYKVTCSDQTLEMDLSKLDLNGNTVAQISQTMTLTGPSTMNLLVLQGKQQFPIDCTLSQNKSK